MVARAQPIRGLDVVLYCDGAEPFLVTARDPKHAAVVALGLISARGALNAGDSLMAGQRRTARPARKQQGIALLVTVLWQ
jgi:hypothetical protein